MAAKINWHRYGTKLRHYHPMYCLLYMGDYYVITVHLFRRAVTYDEISLKLFVSLL